jgi:hypothetical protein
MYTDEDYLTFEIGEGDSGIDIRCRTKKLVKVRKNHDCHLEQDDPKCEGIKKGDTALRDKAICYGEWGSCYVCLPCISRWFRSIGVYPDQSRFECKCDMDGEICGVYEKSEQGDFCDRCEHDETCHEANQPTDPEPEKGD